MTIGRAGSQEFSGGMRSRRFRRCSWKRLFRSRFLRLYKGCKVHALLRRWSSWIFEDHAKNHTLARGFGEDQVLEVLSGSNGLSVDMGDDLLRYQIGLVCQTTRCDSEDDNTLFTLEAKLL